MMNSEHRLRISVKARLWLAIMAIVAAVIATLWVLQVVLLPDFYMRSKQDDVQEIAREVAVSIQNNGLWGTTDLLRRAASERSVCIDISAVDYQEVMWSEGLGDSCYLHSNALNRFRVLKDAMQNAGQFRVSQNMPHPNFDTKYMTCAVAGVTAGDGGTYVVVVTTSLGPLGDVTGIMNHSLFAIAPLLLAAATLIAFLIARSVTKPLYKISGAARQIAQGSLNVLADVSSNDEIGDLARDFNTMSREISKVNLLQRELVANISHDIRTPLTMIKGYAEMIKDITGDDKEAREQQLDIIVDETNRLSILVSDVMDLSLMQAGQTAFHPQVFDITEKARDILGRYQLLEQTRGFAFQLEAEGPCPVYADEVRIEQVIYNLVNNAVNHIGGEKRITLRVLLEGEDVRVEVTDTGTGIRAEDLPLIWDRYYKPYKNGEKQAMGTGLGLSIVKAILVNHHSRFGVNSTLGVGSTFWFTLRRAAPDPAEGQLPL